MPEYGEHDDAEIAALEPYVKQLCAYIYPPTYSLKRPPLLWSTCPRTQLFSAYKIKVIQRSVQRYLLVDRDMSEQ